MAETLILQGNMLPWLGYWDEDRNWCHAWRSDNKKATVTVRAPHRAGNVAREYKVQPGDWLVRVAYSNEVATYNDAGFKLHFQPDDTTREKMQARSATAQELDAIFQRVYRFPDEIYTAMYYRANDGTACTVYHAATEPLPFVWTDPRGRELAGTVPKGSWLVLTKNAGVAELDLCDDATFHARYLTYAAWQSRKVESIGKYASVGRTSRRFIRHNPATVIKAYQMRTDGPPGLAGDWVIVDSNGMVEMVVPRHDFEARYLPVGEWRDG